MKFVLRNSQALGVAIVALVFTFTNMPLIASEAQKYADFPEADVDLPSASLIQLILRPEPAPDVSKAWHDKANAPGEQVILRGHVRIRRSAPADIDGDGRYEITQEIVQAEGTGVSMLTGGIVQLTQHPELRSMGMTVQQKAGRDFPADSYFKIYVQVKMPENPDIPLLMNLEDEPILAAATLTQIPPFNTPFAHIPKAVPLRDGNRKVIAWTIQGMKPLTPKSNITEDFDKLYNRLRDYRNTLDVDHRKEIGNKLLCMEILAEHLHSINVYPTAVLNVLDEHLKRVAELEAARPIIGNLRAQFERLPIKSPRSLGELNDYLTDWIPDLRDKLLPYVHHAIVTPRTALADMEASLKTATEEFERALGTPRYVNLGVFMALMENALRARR